MKTTNERQDEQSKSHWYSSELFKVFFYPVFIVVLSIGLSNWFWIKQFENTQGQQFLEMKIKAFENYASTATKMITLYQFAIRIRIEKMQLIEEVTDKMLDTANLKEGDSVCITPNSKTQDSCLYVVAKREPENYKYYLQYIETQNENAANSAIAVLLFDTAVRARIDYFKFLFTDHELTNQMIYQKGTEHFSIKDIDKLKLVNKMVQDKDDQLNKILFAMSNEICGVY